MGEGGGALLETEGPMGACPSMKRHPAAAAGAQVNGKSRAVRADAADTRHIRLIEESKGQIVKHFC